MALQHHISSKALQLRVGHNVADCNIGKSSPKVLSEGAHRLILCLSEAEPLRLSNLTEPRLLAEQRNGHSEQHGEAIFANTKGSSWQRPDKRTRVHHQVADNIRPPCSHSILRICWLLLITPAHCNILASIHPSDNVQCAVPFQGHNQSS